MKKEIFSISDTDKVEEFLEKKRDEETKKEMQMNKEFEESIERLKETIRSSMATQEVESLTDKQKTKC